jgi:glycosyltransferase involved in cell wall biosynthesis
LDVPPGVRRLSIIAVTGNLQSASFQQRVLAFVEPLARRGIDLTCEVMSHRRGERKVLLGKIGRYDALWLHRVLMPPWRMNRWRRAARRIVFGFDDPIMYSTHGRGLMRRIKFAWTLRRCDGAIVASRYLADLAGRYCPQAWVVPMAIDLPAGCGAGVSPACAVRGAGVSPACAADILSASGMPARAGNAGNSEDAGGTTATHEGKMPATHADKMSASHEGETPSSQVQLLWLGSRSTQKYLREIGQALAEVGRLRPNARLRVVGHEEFAAGPLKVDFRRWSPGEQDQALGECDIGLCPMPDTPWTRGKCPYKVLQYMAASMAWVGSAVGENLVSAGAEDAPDPRGLCAASEEQWVSALTRLIDDAALRRSMGASGLVYVRRVHEREMLADRLAEILRSVVGRPGEREL